MNKRRIKRGSLLLTALLLLTTAALPASADDGSETESAAAESRLSSAAVVDLGVVPDETETEKACDILLVVDTATGVMIHEKNIDVPMPVSGSLIQLLTALVALDYVSPDDVITVTQKQAEAFPEEGAKFGLVQSSKVYVSDLLASMLYTNAVDSAAVLTEAVVKKAGAPSFGALMAEKAEKLLMTDTDYSACSGCGSDLVLTTARDQCRLYLAALSSEGMGLLLKSGVYTVRSKQAFYTPTPVPTDTPAPTQTPIPAASEEPPAASTPKPTRTPRPTSAPRKKAEEQINPEIMLPDEVINPVSAADPNSEDYDIRLSFALSCTASYARKSYSAVYSRAVDYRSDMVILSWSQAEDGGISAKTLSDLIEIFSRRKVLDLVPYIQAAAGTITIEKGGLTINGWSLADGYALYGRQMNGYDPGEPDQATSSFDLSKLTVRLQPDANTLLSMDDGSRTVSALVLVNNEVAGTATLCTASKAAKTDDSGTATIDLYSDDDIMPAQPTLMSQYGWIVLIAGAVLLAMLAIIIGVLIRNRMER